MRLRLPQLWSKHLARDYLELPGVSREVRCQRCGRRTPKKSLDDTLKQIRGVIHMLRVRGYETTRVKAFFRNGSTDLLCATKSYFEYSSEVVALEDELVFNVGVS